MMAKRNLQRALSLLAILGFTANAYAVSSGFYIGGQLGYARSGMQQLTPADVPGDVNQVAMNTKPINIILNNMFAPSLYVQATPAGFAATSPFVFPFKSSVGSSTYIGRFFLGYQFLPWIGGEFGFSSLGMLSDEYTATSVGMAKANITAINSVLTPATLTGNYASVKRTDDYQKKMVDLFIKLSVPVYGFEAYVKFGGAYMLTKTETSIKVDSLTNASVCSVGTTPGCPAPAPVIANGFYNSSMALRTKTTSSSSKLVPGYGFGVAYYYAQNLGFDLSYTKMAGKNSNDLSYVALGISYHFVETYCGQFLCD